MHGAALELLVKRCVVEGRMNSVNDTELMRQMRQVAASATPETLGDAYEEAILLAFAVQSPVGRQEAQFYLSHLEEMAKRATVGWKLFKSPELPEEDLTDDEIVRLLIIVATLQTFVEGVEALDAVSFLTGPSSRKVTFFVLSVYHFIAALYLLSPDGDPMGGMVYKALKLTKLTHLLDPVRDLLDREYANGISFGETARRIRNKSLAHGTFSPEDVAPLVRQTRMRDPAQIIRLADLIWELHHQSALLLLKLTALLTVADPPLGEIFTKVV